MDYLLAVRHGSESEGGGLSKSGIAEMQKFAAAAKSCIGDSKKVAVLTSPKKRAVESGEIVARKFGVRSEVFPALIHEHYRNGSLLVEEMLRTVSDYDAVIMIGHNSAPAGIINVLSRADARDGIKEERSSNGCGFCYSFEDRDYICLP